MAVNPMEMMKLGERLNIFRQQHPRFRAFLQDVSEHAISEGSIVELKVTSPDGREYVTNLKLTAEDMETIEILKKMRN